MTSDWLAPASASDEAQRQNEPGRPEYLKRIDATLEPDQGYFAIHGGTPKVLAGDWSGDLVAIEFPTSIVRTPGTCQIPTNDSSLCARRTPTAGRSSLLARSANATRRRHSSAATLPARRAARR